MTLNQSLTLFGNIAAAHYQIKDFAYGELWELNGEIKPGISYPLMFVVPIDSTTTDQTQQRRFLVLVCDRPKKDKSNEAEILSDSEQILNDVVKTFRNESDDYELIGDPVLIPFKEDFGDWLSGYRTELVIQSDFNSNYCDIPSSTFVSPVTVPGYGVIKDITTGATITTLRKGEIYYIQILDTVEQTLGTVTPTIIQLLT